MKLRTRLLLLLVALHLLLAALATLLLLDERAWLLAAELAFAISLVVSYRLVSALFAPLELIRTGAELIAEKDFASKFVEGGQPELDDLIQVYNRMIDQLREERLRAQEQHYLLERITQASPGGILICDFDGRVVQMNPSARRLLESEALPLLGHRLSEIDHSVARVLSALAPGESRVIAPSLRMRLRCHRGALLDKGFTRDFYLVEELTEELRASERAAYEKLIRMMSHEVNNSVGAVRSLLESCGNYAGQLREEDRDDFRKALEVASSRVENLNQFMNGFAEVVRIPAPARRPCDLGILLGDIVKLMRPDCDARGIRCDLVVDATMGPVSIDKNQIEQVLLNLIKNAIEAMDGPGGVLALRAGVLDGRAFLSVADTGPGLPDPLGERIFTPFFSTKRDGRGLGLTLTQEILAQHGFDFSFRNRAEGGAEFTIWFGAPELPAGGR